MKNKLKELTKENLQDIILNLSASLTEQQLQKLDKLIKQCIAKKSTEGKKARVVRMSQELVDEKMAQLKNWMEQIDDGKLYLDTEEYEDYSDNYWDSDWIVEYYDNQGVGDKIMYAIEFAKDCVDDCRYQEALSIYKWLWQMEVSTQNEYIDETEPADFETLVENKIVKTDVKQIALLTLYADYQALNAAKRAKDIYQFFSLSVFEDLHIEDMFHVGREDLKDIERFWTDWIALLKTKSGDNEARLLQEAVLQKDGIEGLVKIADEICSVHPSIYLTAMELYDKNHDYEQIEKIGAQAMKKINKRLKIRGEIALQAAYASSYQMHIKNMMRFCWECFYSDATVRNYLRLFGTDEMAIQYGMQGKVVLSSGIKASPDFGENRELLQNFVGDFRYYELCFYTGEFELAKNASRNPQGSLGWSSCFIKYGIRLFLLYLYEKELPSKAAAAIAQSIGFDDETDQCYVLHFEKEFVVESRKNKTSLFWTYFKRWKQYFPMEIEERKKYLEWAEKIVYSRADAIVSGQHRGQYRDVAALLAITAEIKENMGTNNARNEIFALYKKKFPRHSSFQGEMKAYFNYK